MRKQHTLLAGVAALALFAASGIATAQQTQQGAGGAAQSSSTQSQRSQQGANNQGRNQSANQNMRSQGAQQGKNQNAMSGQSSGQNAQNQSSMQRQGNTGRSSNRAAQEQNRNRGTSATNRTAQGQQNQRNAQSRTTQSRNGQFATQERNRNQRGTTTAQRNEQLKGLQGSTRTPMQGGGANVSLNDQQRVQIRDTVINSRTAPRVSNVDFNVNVGTVVPRGHIHLVRVPETLIRVQPRWRHYLYFVYNDEIVIVDPRTMRIIDVMPV
jgi:hypothetical protein